ncbi:hypothetical protein MKEN_01104800 [Mycena kentingensis (nom. inval.)]|nr:hypothetical protein MKEN_01104800 [Mycena kentingensis (nom. inval.)]
MSSPRPASKATAVADGDHRKRRRNRTTQSCLNCHTTKRMCDRKRPCTRCSQLGIASNCVYEVDDPNRQAQGDEHTRLMNRVAELEGVIRELKNKATPSSPRPTPIHASGSSTPRSDWLNPTLPYVQYGHPASGHNPNDPLASLISAYSGLTEHMMFRHGPGGGTCGCLNEASCYNVVLDLSLRLRKAADVLARSPSHTNPSECALNTHISDLDMFAKNMLLDVPSYDPLYSSMGLGRGLSITPPSSGSSSSLGLSPDSHYGQVPNLSAAAWGQLDDAEFMAWAPPAR